MDKSIATWFHPSHLIEKHVFWLRLGYVDSRDIPISIRRCVFLRLPISISNTDVGKSASALIILATTDFLFWIPMLAKCVGAKYSCGYRFSIWILMLAKRIGADFLATADFLFSIFAECVGAIYYSPSDVAHWCGCRRSVAIICNWFPLMLSAWKWLNFSDSTGVKMVEL